MQKLVLILSVFLLASCGAKKGSSTASAKFTLENLEKMDGNHIRSAYPDASIEEGVGMFEEGTEERAYTILYPGTENEIQITWKDKERKNIHDVQFSGEGKWKSKTGIGIGTTYDELNRLNSKPISFYGFGWDYSGAVVWNGGKFEKSGLRVFLSPQTDHADKYYTDKMIKATPEEIEALDLKVASIIINYSIQ